MKNSVLLLLFLLPITSFAYDTAKYSPALYKHVPKANDTISQFLSCHSTWLGRNIDKGLYNTERFFFNSKTDNLAIILSDWFEYFDKRDYGIAFKDLIQGKKVNNITRYYDEIMEGIKAAESITKLLFVEKKKKTNYQSCSVSFSDINRLISGQYDIALSWSDLVFVYIDIGNSYRKYLEKENELLDKYQQYQITRKKIQDIENAQY